MEPVNAVLIMIPGHHEDTTPFDVCLDSIAESRAVCTGAPADEIPAGGAPATDGSGGVVTGSAPGDNPTRAPVALV